MHDTSIKQRLIKASHSLSAHSTSARLDADLLLCHILQKPRSYLFTWPEQHINDRQIRQFDKLLARRRNGEPIAHITGEREFWSLLLKVTSDTLIPRPETEQLVEQALSHIPPQKKWKIADLGTGSGAIALAIASERPECEVIAADCSETALLIARSNARRLHIGNIHFHQGNWLNAMANNFDMIVSNPPYISADDPHLSQDGLSFEPQSALVAGNNGMADIESICRQAHQHLHPGGWLLLEHGYNQRQASSANLIRQGYQNIKCFQDFSGIDRIIQAQSPA